MKTWYLRSTISFIALVTSTFSLGLPSYRYVPLPSEEARRAARERFFEREESDGWELSFDRSTDKLVFGYKKRELDDDARVSTVTTLDEKLKIATKFVDTHKDSFGLAIAHLKVYAKHHKLNEAQISFSSGEIAYSGYEHVSGARYSVEIVVTVVGGAVTSFRASPKPLPFFEPLATTPYLPHTAPVIRSQMVGFRIRMPDAKFMAHEHVVEENDIPDGQLTLTKQIEGDRLWVGLAWQFTVKIPGPFARTKIFVFKADNGQLISGESAVE